MLVFAVTGAIVINDVSHGAISHPGIAMVSGLVVMVLVYLVGHISGAHFNPAVTLGFWVNKRFPGKKVVPYMGAQALGAFLASFLMKLGFPLHPTIGATLAGRSLDLIFGLEVLLTLFLVVVILVITTREVAYQPLVGVVIGATIGLEVLFAGPISASMNPIRSLAPAVVSGHFEGLWIYLSAPFLGALSSVLVMKALIFPPAPISR